MAEEKTYIEMEKIPEDQGLDRINNRFRQILSEIASLKASLAINENKIRDLMIKESKTGNIIYVNGKRTKINPKSDYILCFDEKGIDYPTSYHSIDNIVVKKGDEVNVPR